MRKYERRIRRDRKNNDVIEVRIVILLNKSFIQGLLHYAQAKAFCNQHKEKKLKGRNLLNLKFEHNDDDPWMPSFLLAN